MESRVLSPESCAGNDLQAIYSKQRRFAVLIALFFAWFIGFADRIAISTAIVPITKEFALSPQEVGYVLSSFYIAYAIMQIGGGWLADKFGAKIVLVGCVAAWSVFTGLTGMAWSLTSLIVIRVLFGLGEGGFSPASSVTIAETFPVSERARAKSFVLSSTMLGTAIGAGFVAAMIHNYGWREAYHTLGIIGVLVALVLLVVLKGNSTAYSTSHETKPKLNVVVAIRNPLVRKLLVIWFFGNVTALGLQSWMPSYLANQLKLDILHIGAASAIPFLISFLGFNGVGWLLDKYGSGREKMFIVGGALVTVIALVLMLSTTSIVMLVVYSTLGSLAYNFVFATIFAIPLKYAPRHAVGSITGIVNFGGQIAGAVSPIVIGFMVAWFDGSYVPAFLFLAGSGLIAAFVGMFLRTDSDSQTM